MPETETNPAKPPRFPYVAALLCAACVSAAAWTWMRYSFCRKVAAAPIFGASLNKEMLHRYVEVAGASSGCWMTSSTIGPGLGGVRLRDPSADYSPDSRSEIMVVLYRSAQEAERHWVHLQAQYGGGRWTFRGRVVFANSRLAVDATASRFHGASVAGLVVGAMGVFVFTVALRHWLRERRQIVLQEPS